MRFSDRLELLEIEYSSDEIGQQVARKTSRKVFANPYRFYSARFIAESQNGAQPEREFQIRTADYHGESHAMYRGKEYEIMNSTEQGEFTRLMLKDVIGSE